MKSFFNSQEFGDLTKIIQIMFDQASEQHVTLFGKTYIDDWFTYELPQFGLSVDELVGKYHLRVMASVIADKSLPPTRRWEGLQNYHGEIPRIGHKVIMDVDQLRKTQQYLESRRISDEAKKRKLLDTMIGNTRDVVLGVKDTLDFIVLSAMFNGGIVEFNEFNNPEGIRYTTNYLMPEANKLKAHTAWTDEALKNGTIDPVEEFLSVIQKFKNKVQFESILVSPTLRYKILRSKMLRLAIRGVDKAATPVRDDELNAELGRLGIPPIQEITKANDVLKDGIRQEVTPINDDTAVFKPVGKLGIIQPAFEDNEIVEEDNVSYANMENGIRTAQWKVGESTGQVAGEYMQASTRALPIFQAINGIVNYKVNNL